MAAGSDDADSLELRELATQLRKLEVEQRRLDLKKARALDPIERGLKAAQLRSEEIANQEKTTHQDNQISKIRWERAGLVVAWIGVLVPIYYSAWQLWMQRDEVLDQRKVAADQARKNTVREAAGRFGAGPTAAALELALYDEGHSVLVGGVRGVADGPGAATEIERTLAALVVLKSFAVELTPVQRGALELERDRGVDHLYRLVLRMSAGKSKEGDKQAFFIHCEINERLRLLLGEDGKRWKDVGAEVQNYRENLLKEEYSP